MFGPKTGTGDGVYRDAKFLNSGSVIGPLGDLHRFINAGLTEIGNRTMTTSNTKTQIKFTSLDYTAARKSLDPSFSKPKKLRYLRQSRNVKAETRQNTT